MLAALVGTRLLSLLAKKVGSIVKKIQQRLAIGLRRRVGRDGLEWLGRAERRRVRSRCWFRRGASSPVPRRIELGLNVLEERPRTGQRCDELHERTRYLRWHMQMEMNVACDGLTVDVAGVFGAGESLSNHYSGPPAGASSPY